MNRKKRPAHNNGIPWINPIGGYGDILMVSGVLKLVHDKDPRMKFNLIRRTKYPTMFHGHPAIEKIGLPPKDADILGVDYWKIEPLGPDNQRPYQILARAFGLKTPVEEQLYLPGELEKDPLLHDFIPWKKTNIIIAPSSDSPRKGMHPTIWHNLVDKLHAEDNFVMQVGMMRDQRIRNAYSLLGLTTPRQLISLINKCDLVITCDNFIMHAAHLMGVKGVVLWGPTNNRVYGYPEHVHLQMGKSCGLPENEDCIGPTRNEGGRLYGTPCPLGERHCMNQIRPEAIYDAVKNVLIRRIN